MAAGCAEKKSMRRNSVHATNARPLGPHACRGPERGVGATIATDQSVRQATHPLFGRVGRKDRPYAFHRAGLIRESISSGCTTVGIHILWGPKKSCMYRLYTPELSPSSTPRQQLLQAYGCVQAKGLTAMSQQQDHMDATENQRLGGKCIAHCKG